MANYLCSASGINTAVNSIADCLAIDPAAYIMSSASMLAQQPTLTDIFNIPVSGDLLQMWELGFGLPVFCYLVAWGYGTVINYFDRWHP